MNRLPGKFASPPPLAQRSTLHNAPRIGAFSASSPTESDSNWWMITLSDLTLLLLGFLVMWYASTKANLKTAPSTTAVTVDRKNPAPANFPSAAPLSDESWQAVRNDLHGFIKREGLANDVTIESTRGQIILSLRDRVPFASGKADLRPRALPVLEKIVVVVLAQPELSVGVSGHTDNLRIANAEFPSNWELSTARASRVARYLIVKGIHPSRIAVQGYAAYRPRQPNSSAANRRSNRRVEIRLFQKNSAAAKDSTPE